MTRPPNMRSRRDLLGGLFHFAAEVTALAGLLAISAVLAWLMLLP